MQSSHKYLNTAATGLIEPGVRAAGDAFNAELATGGSARAEQWRQDDDPAIRDSVATFLGTAPANIALIPNFSWGLNGILFSLRGTERVLLYRGDYPSLTEPFLLNNFPITWIESTDGFTLPLEEIRQRIRNREVDIVALSHVQYNSGYRLPIEEIGRLCREYGVCFIVDATQSLGCLPLDLSNQYADVLIASNYKWMNAGFGTGIMYINDYFLQAYPPVVIGNNSLMMGNPNAPYEGSALNYEPGHPNMYGFTILKEAIRHKQSLGLQEIEAHNMRLTGMLLDGIRHLPLQLLGPATTESRSAMVFLRDVNGLSEHIRKQGIIVTARGGLIRISMHYYNRDADVTAMLACLAKR